MQNNDQIKGNSQKETEDFVDTPTSNDTLSSPVILTCHVGQIYRDAPPQFVENHNI